MSLPNLGGKLSEQVVLKVIGGEFRGRSLASVSGQSTRPPLARVRAAVANILAARIQGARVLDLFAGTGSYSIELISRGASSALCVDKDPRAVEVIRKNVASLGIADRVSIVHGDALKVIGMLQRSGDKFDIVLVAPPYFSGLDQASMELLGDSRLLRDDAMVVLQQHRREVLRKVYGLLHLRKTYSYGDTRISTFALAEHPFPGE